MHAPHSPSPWHPGEIALQRAAGVAERMDEVGRLVLRPFLTEEHRGFYPLLATVVLGTVDATGAPWATLRAGPPGFVQSPDPQQLALALPIEPEDPAEAGLVEGAAIGLLGIDFATRRRNRLNGRLRGRSAAGFRLEVGQSFGNCPRFIPRRDAAFARDPGLPSPLPARHETGLDARARALIGGAESFFVASLAELPGRPREVDVSHRGGQPGFVRIEAEGTLLVPEFAGNMFFNTLGNFSVTPRAGLVFADPASGDLLQMTGAVTLLDAAPAAARFAPGTRFWRFRPDAVVHRPGALALRWEPAATDAASPWALRSGHWA